MDQNTQEKLQQAMNMPARMLLQLDFSKKIVGKYCPPAAGMDAEDLTDTVTVAAFLQENHVSKDNAAAMFQELMTAFAKFQEAWAAEAKAFDPDVDLSDDHYLWGSPEMNEKCVQSIEKRYAGRTGEIVFYGPSNITYWYSLEKDMLPWKAQNHGMGGCTDEDLMHYADRLLYPFNPRAVFFQTGSNDLAEGITPEQVLKNKEKMYGMFLENLPDTELVVMSGLPLPGRTQFWEATDRTNQYLKELCEKHDRLHFMDATPSMLTDHGEERLRTPDGRYFNPEYFRMDRIHLNVKGHQIWTGLMKKELEKIGITPEET